MIRRYRIDLLAVASLIVLVGIVFFRLFYPEPLLIVTPDFGRSDAWHFSFATKVSLSQALSRNTLPLWEPLFGGGFPLFAEGQVGALFLPNLILFRLLPVVYAYNSALALTFVTLAIGSYLYLRALQRSVMASVFASVVLTFSGLPVLQMTHMSLLQGMTLLPLIGWAGLLTAEHPSGRRSAWLSVLIAQQIFAGFPQATFITLLFLITQTVFLSMRRASWRPLIFVILSVMLGIGLGALQLLPSYEFLTQIGSSTSGFDYHTASYFSFPLVHIRTLLDPFALGNPRLGTYKPFYSFDGSIFWENTAYMGIIPLLLTLVFFLDKRKNVWKPFWAAVLGGSVLLALGKYAPTYLLYAFWPFTLFRVPSRFLWISAMALAAASAFGWDRLMGSANNPKKCVKRVAALMLVVTTLIQLALAWQNYHLAVPANVWLQPSPLTQNLPANARVLTPDVGMRYTEAYSSGWEDTSAYEALRVVPMPNSNIVSTAASFMTYAGRFILRNSLSESLVLSHMAIGPNEATISAVGQKLLTLYGVTTVMMTEPLTHEGLIPTQSLELAPGVSATAYQNPHAVPRFRLVSSAASASMAKEVAQITTADAFDPQTSTVLAAHDIARYSAFGQFIDREARSNNARMTLLSDTSTHVRLMIQDNPAPSLLVTTDSYYPGWIGAIDGKETPLVPTNFSQRALVVPAGTHTVDMYFRPWSLRIGVVVSLAALAILAGLVVRPRRF